MKPKICLNMIVKNEASDIERCLNSVKPYIDYYLISDTGSTDNTPEIIRKVMDGVPGEIVFHDWVNFGYNREKILQEAYKYPDIDYCLIIDADEELKVEDKSAFDNLTADAYYIERRIGSFSYKLPALLNIKKVDWHWKGAVHNYLVGANVQETLEGVFIVSHKGGGGKSSGVSSKEKFLNDATLLEQELKRNPNDARSRFYLAQSYRDAGDYKRAYENYLKRTKMGGWAQEVYYALFQLAACKWKSNNVFPTEDFLNAYDYRPTRSEAIYEVARHYRLVKKQYHLAYIFAKAGYEIPPTKDVLFIHRDIEEWRMADELAVSAYKVGKFKESEELCDELLSNGKLPEREIERVKKNREFARGKLAQ